MENRVIDFIVVFTSIVWEAMPFIVLGAVIAGAVEEFVPQQLITKLIPKNRPLAIAMSALLGIFIPMCECGIIPVMRRLLRKGVPLSCCVAYLLAGPIINPIVFLSTLAAFYPHDYGVIIIALRMILGFLVACGTALVVDRSYKKYGSQLLANLAMPKTMNADNGEDREPRKPLAQRLGNMSEVALHDFLDIMVFLILGALLAATTRLFLTNSEIAEYAGQRPLLAIVVMMALAVILCLCSEADAFVAASFVTLLPSAKVAFLVLGPMLDFKLYFMYTRVFRPRLIWTIITAVVLQVFFYSALTQLAYQNGLLDRMDAFIKSIQTSVVSQPASETSSK